MAPLINSPKFSQTLKWKHCEHSLIYFLYNYIRVYYESPYNIFFHCLHFCWKLLNVKWWQQPCEIPNVHWFDYRYLFIANGWSLTFACNHNEISITFPYIKRKQTKDITSRLVQRCYLVWLFLTRCDYFLA